MNEYTNSDVDAVLRGKSESESFAHATARSLMCRWLREAARENLKVDPFADGRITVFGEISWRINRGEPHFGVWEEYPHDGYFMVWDERPEWGGWGDGPYPDRPPTFDECVAMGKPPITISDIAIQHKGFIAHVIEIVHKHEPEQRALDHLIREVGCHVWVVPARWVLGQISVPKRIPLAFLVSP